MEEEWIIRIRDQDREFVGEVDDETAFEARVRWLGAGSWALSVAADSQSAELLQQPGAGIQFEVAGRIVLSGPATKLEDQVSEQDGPPTASDTGLITVTGVDDTYGFRRVIYPDPAVAITSGGVKHPVERTTITGPAETVIGTLINQQAGPAALPGRRHPGLVVPASQGRGPTVTSAERFADLHEHAWALAEGANLGWRVVQHDTDLVVEFWEPADLTDEIAFAVELGNVASYTYELTPPEVTHLIYGVGGEGTDREFYQYVQTSLLWPGVVVEEFVDARDLPQQPETPGDPDWQDPAVATAQRAQERFAEARATQTVAFDLLPTEGLVWGVDVDLGDQVSFLTDRGPVTDQIREVVYRRDASTGQTITPIVGDPIHIPAVYRALRRLRRDVQALQTT